MDDKISDGLNGFNCNTDCGFLEMEHNSFAARSIRVEQHPDHWEIGCPIAMPIVMSSTYHYVDGPKGVYEYSRVNSLTRATLEKVLASLEGAKYAVTFGSGMGAIGAVFNLLSAGDHVVTTEDLYCDTHGYLKRVGSRFNITATFVKDCTEVANIVGAVQENTKMVYVESPTNPRMKLVDLAALAKEVKQKNKDILLVIDNTYLTPFFQRPLGFGFDISLHSMTKYLNGHSDVVMGCIMYNRKDLYKQFRDLQFYIGAVPSPFDCYLVNRGLKTLKIRMMEHMRTGLAVARFLESHPAVERVLHPGLPSHPQHELAKRQSYGHSGMLALYVKGGEQETRQFLRSLQVFMYAPSWGGFESLVNYPKATMSINLEGLEDNLIRLSVGLEESQDLIADLDQALNSTMKISLAKELKHDP